MLRKMNLLPSRHVRTSSATGGGERRRNSGKDGKRQLSQLVATAPKRERYTSGTRRSLAPRRKQKQHPYARRVELRKREQLTVPASRRLTTRKRRRIALRKQTEAAANK
jgi:hypothetical protein